MRLKEKAAFITGASSGIGAIVARMFAREGAKVALAARRIDRCEEIAAEIRSTGGEAIAVRMDQSRERDVELAVAQTVRVFGRLDVLVNNAGPVDLLLEGKDTVTHNIASESFDALMKVALYGPFWCCKYAIPHMIAASGGSIVNITSIAAVTGMSRLPAYSAAKGGLSALTRSVAFDYGRSNIRSNSIITGLIVHEGSEHTIGTPEKLAAARERHLTPRLGVPEDIGYAAIYLASDESGVVTGSSISVEGGTLIKNRSDSTQYVYEK